MIGARLIHIPDPVAYTVVGTVVAVALVAAVLQFVSVRRLG